MKMALLGARPTGFSRFPSSSSYLSSSSRSTSSSLSSILSLVVVGKSIISRGCVACSAVQESSIPTVTAETKGTTPPSAATETNAAVAGGKEEAKAAPKAAPVRSKPAAKAPAKPLPELM